MRVTCALLVVCAAALAVAAAGGAVVRPAAELLRDAFAEPKYQLLFPDAPRRLQDADVADAGDDVTPRQQQQQQHRRMRVTAPSGQRFECDLPDAPADDAAGDGAGQREQSTVREAELLEPLRAQCMYKLQGWWVYEFCYGQHVRQFHEEADKTVPRMQYILGMFRDVSELDAPQRAPGAPDPDGGDEQGLYYTQHYSDGTVCDLTNEPRTTEVRFQCNLQMQDHITLVKETSTCKYLVIISTPRLCIHPKYKPFESTALPVPCYAVLDEEQWARHQAQAQKAKAAQATAPVARATQGAKVHGLAMDEAEVVAQEPVVQVVVTGSDPAAVDEALRVAAEALAKAHAGKAAATQGTAKPATPPPPPQQQQQPAKPPVAATPPQQQPQTPEQEERTRLFFERLAAERQERLARILQHYQKMLQTEVNALYAEDDAGVPPQFAANDVFVRHDGAVHIVKSKAADDDDDKKDGQAAHGGDDLPNHDEL